MSLESFNSNLNPNSDQEKVFESPESEILSEQAKAKAKEASSASSLARFGRKVALTGALVASSLGFGSEAKAQNPADNIIIGRTLHAGSKGNALNDLEDRDRKARELAASRAVNYSFWNHKIEDPETHDYVEVRRLALKSNPEAISKVIGQDALFTTKSLNIPQGKILSIDEANTFLYKNAEEKFKKYLEELSPDNQRVLLYKLSQGDMELHHKVFDKEVYVALDVATLGTEGEAGSLLGEEIAIRQNGEVNLVGEVVEVITADPNDTKSDPVYLVIRFFSQEDAGKPVEGTKISRTDKPNP